MTQETLEGVIIHCEYLAQECDRLAEQLVYLKHFQMCADARFKDHGLQTMTYRLEKYPNSYPL